MAMDSDGERDEDEDGQNNLFRSTQQQTCTDSTVEETDGPCVRVSCSRGSITSLVMKRTDNNENETVEVFITWDFDFFLKRFSPSSMKEEFLKSQSSQHLAVVLTFKHTDFFSLSESFFYIIIIINCQAWMLYCHKSEEIVGVF